MGLKTYMKRGLKYIISGQPVYHTSVEVKVSAPTGVLKNRNILITGGGRGLGFAIAEKCISEGAHVILTGRREETLRKASEKLGPDCRYLVYDIRTVDGMKQLMEQAEKISGGKKIDSLVSNAGISLHEGSFRNVNEEGWDLQMETNLKGNYFLVKTFVEYLESKEDPAGNVVVITSERGKRADDIPYGLTKAAANSFVQAMARSVIGEGIRINGVAPGVTASAMTGFDPEGNLYADYQAGKRIFLPEEVAEVVHFLLSDFSSCIAGEIIACDQGRYIAGW